MKTILRKLFGASASGGVMGGLYLLALTGLVLAVPNRAQAIEVTGRYLRLTVTHAQTKSDTCEATHNASQYGVALAEMQLFHGDTEVEPVAVSSNYPDGGGSSTNLAHLTNGTTAGNDKFWVTDSTLSENLTVTFDLGEGGATLDRYVLTLADVRYRHPVAWTMELSDDQTDWTLVDWKDYGAAANVPAAYAALDRDFRNPFRARYLRVSFTHTQNRADTVNPDTTSGFGLAIAEMEAYSGDTKLTPANVTVPIDGAADTGAKDKLTDGIVSNGNKWYLTDDILNVVSGGTVALPSITFDFGEDGADLTGYRLYMADVNYRNPVAWVAEISDDNATWTEVDRVDYGTSANVPAAYAVVTRDLAAAEADPVARFVRFVFTDWQTSDRTCEPGNNSNYYGIEISELRVLHDDVDLTDGIDPTANYEGEPNYKLPQIHDGNYNSSYWISNGTMEGGEAPWVQFDLGQPQAVDSYFISLASRYCVPLAWRVELSDDGHAWRVWDYRAYATPDDVPATKTFVAVTPVSEGGAPAGKRARSWRYLRFSSDFAPSDGVALGQVEPLLDGMSALPGAGVTVSGSSIRSGTAWGNIVDGTFCIQGENYKAWGNGNAAVSFTLDLGKEVAFDGYRVQLADHGPRNPIQWTVEVSEDGAEWTLFDTQCFGGLGAATAYFGSTSSSGTNSPLVANRFYTWRDFAGDADVAYEDAPALTGRSVSFVLGACGQSGAADISGNGLYGVAPYQVPGDGWNNLGLSGSDAYTLDSVHDNAGDPVEGMTFAVAANHGALQAVSIETDPDYTDSDGVMARGYCLLQEGTETMVALKSKNDTRGEIGSEDFDEFTVTGVPYAKFTAVLYLGRGIYTAHADGHDPIVVNQTWKVGTGGGTPVKRNIKYTYADGKLSIVETEGDQTTKEGLWGDPSIAWSNEVGSGVMVIPNLTPDANGNFSFNISWKNNGGNNASARTMFRGVQLVEQSATWNEPLAAGVGSVGFAFQKSGAELQDAALYGMAGYAFRGANWNALTSHTQTLAGGSVIDRDGAVVEGMSMALTRVSGSYNIDNNANNNAALPPFDPKTPYTQCNARVALDGIPYGTYALVLYLNKDLGWGKGDAIGPVKVTVDGTTTSYTYKNGALAVGSDDWGTYGQAGVVGQEGIGVMVIPGLTATSLSFETTGGDYNSQLQGFQIVQDPDAENVGSGLLHAFHFDEIDSAESRDVAPIDVGVGGRAMAIASDLGSGYKRFVAAGEGRFGANALKSGVGIGGLGSNTNSDGLYLYNPNGLGCGSDTGFTLSFFMRINEDSSGSGRRFMSFVVGGKIYELGRYGGTYQWSMYDNNSWDEDADGNKYAVYNSVSQGEWHHVAIVYNPDVDGDGSGKAGLDCYIDGEKKGCWYGAARVPEGQMTHLLIGRGFDSIPGAVTATGTVNGECVRNYDDLDIDEFGLFARSLTAEEIAWLAENPIGVPPGPAADAESKWTAFGPDGSSKYDAGSWSHFNVNFGNLRHEGPGKPGLMPGEAILRSAAVNWYFGTGSANNVNAVRLVLVDAAGNVAAVSDPSAPLPSAAACSTVYTFPAGTKVSLSEQYQGHFVPADTVPEIGSAFSTASHVTVRYQTYAGDGGAIGFYAATNTSALPAISFVLQEDAAGLSFTDGNAINIDITSPDSAHDLEPGHLYGIVPFDTAKWNQLSVEGSPATFENVTDTAGREGITVTVTNKGGIYNEQGFSHPLLHSALGDQADGAVTVTVENIPYEAYDVYLYMPSSAYNNIASVTLNDDTSTYWYMPEGANEAATADTNTYWGVANGSVTTPLLGKTVMRIANRSGSSFKVTTYHGSSNGRGNISAVQIVERVPAAAVNVKIYRDHDLADSGTYGYVPFAGTQWNRLKFSTTNINWSGALTDTQGRPVTVTVAGRDTDGNARPDTADDLLCDALLDNTNGDTSTPYVTVADIPYASYDVYVYMTANEWDLNGSVILNDDASTHYTMNGSEPAVAATHTPWGDPQSDTVQLGMNVIRIPGVTGATCKIQPMRISGTQARASIAAVQIVGRLDIYGGETWVGTLTGDTAASELTLTTADGSRTALMTELPEVATVELTAEADATLTLDAPVPTLGALTFDTGAYTLTLAGANALNVSSATVASGAVALNPGTIALAKGSAIEIASGATLRLLGAEGAGHAVALAGAGTLEVPAGQSVAFSGASPDFAGTVNVAGTLALDLAADLGTATIVVPAGGVFDLNGCPCANALELAGGTLRNSAGNVWADTAASINFRSDSGTPGNDEVAGLMPMLGAYWGKSGNQASNTSGSLTFYPYGQITVSGAAAVGATAAGSLTWSTANTWQNTANATSYLKGYLDDTGNHTLTLTFPESLASMGYDLYLYSSTDSNGSFSARRVTGDDGTEVAYTYVDGVLTAGSTAGWGNPTAGRTTVAEGTNVMVLRDRTDRSLTINFPNSSGRGGLAALQVRVHATTLSGALTVSADSTIEAIGGFTLAGDVSGTGNLTKVGAGALAIEGAAVGARQLLVSAGTLAPGEGADLSQTRVEIASARAWPSPSREPIRRRCRASRMASPRIWICRPARWRGLLTMRCAPRR